MFSRVGLNTTLGRCLVGNLETPNNVAPTIQLIRWRKRRWAPKNESKIYYVRKPTPIDPDEWQKLANLYRPYKTAIKGLAAYFKEEVALKEAAKSSKVQTDKQEAEWAEVQKVNAEWNSETGRIREARQAESGRREDAERVAALAALQEDKLANLMTATQKVQEQVKLSKHFINTDDLDAEIEKALNMRVSYNYAIDKDGNRYVEVADGSTVAETKEAETVRRFEIPQEQTKQLH